MDKLLCLDHLNIACTRGLNISFSLRSSKTIIPPTYSGGNFNSPIDSYVSISISDFSKFLTFHISSITISISFSFTIFGIMGIGI